MNSSSLEVRADGTALVICAAKEHKVQSMDALYASGYLKPLMYALVDMMKRNSNCSSLEIEVRTHRSFTERTPFGEGNECEVPDPAMVLGGTVALWLLSIISSSHTNSKFIVQEAGGLEALADKLPRHIYNLQAEFEDAEGIWISALLLSILFQDADIVSSSTSMHFIPLLAHLLKSDEMIDRFFAAQAIASLVRQRDKGINLSMSLIGHIEIDMPNLVSLSEEFLLVRNPDQVAL